MTVAALVLAAGSSNRLGTPKQLLPIEGRPLVRHVASAARSSCDAVAVVVGAHATRIESALAGLDVVCLMNARWMEGVASSVRTGVGWAAERGFDGVMLLAADQLLVTREHLDALLRAHKRDRAMVASRYCGVLGVPAVFSRSKFQTLMALAGDRGAREVLRESIHDVLPVDWIDGAFDLDAPRHVPPYMVKTSMPERVTRPACPRARRSKA